ncbi:AraC family transcriptional regulator [Burkholderia sp. MSh2]|uniref:AraC family transcriptional regulator n=1 Tax=Burkholderia paludis TaxID=1506587 RepID=A0A6P2P6P6_9BURK|nr:MULTISPECIES: AraC family transcriptional regulator [Burkholderia]KEZ05717.1 AraC family transcriptional regulator [Burkholderia sp. MSh2]KFG94910.1 AraC family transcriptional regulator [Burkholderia paludis]CAB3762454.1 putative HTH-type transcriptional regulator [Burkholderia paludis]VWC02861.1 AraC family transcriptional regulator [Burkholderia paludis]
MNVWNFARSPASVLLMIDFGRDRGIAPSALLKGAQLTLKQLADPDFTVLAAQELAVASNLLDLTAGEPDVGLKVGLSYQLSAYGLLGYGLLSSATGMDAVALAGRYLALTYTFVAMTFRREGRHDAIRFDASPELAANVQRFFVERAMGATCRVLRDVIGGAFELATFDLAYGAAPGSDVRQPVPGAQVRHGQPANTLTFEHALLERPLPQANAATAAMCERMCAELVTRRRTRVDLVSFLNEYLATRPFDRPPLLKDIATLLNTSERTLKRRLQEEGACFRDISNAVRKARAQALIAEGRLSIKEIAQELGFSDMSSFSQAYKRWTGVAPSVSRQGTAAP